MFDYFCLQKIDTSEPSSSTENLPPLPERIRPIGDHRGNAGIYLNCGRSTTSKVLIISK